MRLEAKGANATEPTGTIESMATSLAELTAEQLRARALEWLRENLPTGWIEAVDAGDTQRVDALPRRARRRGLARTTR